MQKVFHILIALGLAIFGIGSVIFVLGQAVCLIAGMPEMVTMIETTVDAVIFPAIVLLGGREDIHPAVSGWPAIIRQNI